jgi:hypothetical protein
MIRLLALYILLGVPVTLYYSYLLWKEELNGERPHGDDWVLVLIGLCALVVWPVTAYSILVLRKKPNEKG